MSGKSVLFVSYGGGHIVMVLPVLQALRELAPDVACPLLALTIAAKPARDAGYAPLGYADFLHLYDSAEVSRWGNELLAGNQSPNVDQQETVAYLGINFLDLIAQHGLDAAREKFARSGRFGFLPINFMSRVLQELKPDLVVATSAPRTEEAAIYAAKSLGIPTISILNLFAFPTHHFVHRRMNADHICVMAEPVAEQLRGYGFGDSTIHVTGNPSFDSLATKENARRAEDFVAGKGWQGRKIIVWAGHGDVIDKGSGAVDISIPTRVEQVLRDYVLGGDDLALVTRYHPGTTHLFPEGPAHPLLHRSHPLQEPLHPLLLAASAVVVEPSTVGVEAAVAGKPVISIEYSRAAKVHYSLEAAGVGEGCHSIEQLPSMLDKVLTSGSAVSSRYRQSGDAAQRCASLIAEQLGRHSGANTSS